MNIHLKSIPMPGAVSIEELPPSARFSLRVARQNRAAVATTFGCELPDRVGAIAAKGNLRALCLGPDEWQLEAAGSDAAAIRTAFAHIYAKVPHSLVDISDREVTFRLEGPQAEELLSVACPRDLARMAPGTGTRTIFDTVQAIVVRETEDCFTLSVWRSFAPHVLEHLAIANTELAIGL